MITHEERSDMEAEATEAMESLRKVITGGLSKEEECAFICGYIAGKTSFKVQESMK